MLTVKWDAYFQLIRIDKPIGYLLLLWPTLWALWLAEGGVPPLRILLVFILGVFLMRSAGCVINDYADRHFDGYVKRTASRPLPKGVLSEISVKLLFIFFVLIAFILVLTLNCMTIYLSIVALGLACIYPFMKRISHLSQLVLGAAFGWSIPMVYSAVMESLPGSAWILFLASMCWTVAYDTQYAMVDRDDDLKIGIKSTAILFGRFDILIISLLQSTMLVLMTILGFNMKLGIAFYIAILIVICLFAYQTVILSSRDRNACFQAFINNNYVGMVLFSGIVLGL